MKNLASATLSFILAISLAGCSTKNLKIMEFSSGETGAPYALRFTQFDIKLKWRVVSCSKSDAGSGDKRGLRVMAEVDAEPIYPDDPKAKWLLDLTSLDSAINTTDLSVTYKNGHFSSFNATVTDKTAETVTATTGAIASVLKLAFPVSQASTECEKLVAKVTEARTALEASTKQLASAKREYLSAKARGLPEATIARFAARAELTADDVREKTEALDKALKTVTVEQKLKWPLSGFEATSTRINLPNEAVKKWKLAEDFPDAKDLAVKFELQVMNEEGAFETVVADQNVTSKAAISSHTARGKIPIRLGRSGQLVATLSEPRDGLDPNEKEILKKKANIIQSGDLLYVPVSYQWPKSSTSSFGLDEVGNLASIGHKKSNAQAEALGGAVKSISDTADTLIQSDLEKLEAENKLLTARKSNVELNAALNPSELSDYQVQLKALQDELALRKAQFELALINRWMPTLEE